ncbi:hypothetical protein D3C87_1423240 [compost metagenome]
MGYRQRFDGELPERNVAQPHEGQTAGIAGLVKQTVSTKGRTILQQRQWDFEFSIYRNVYRYRGNRHDVFRIDRFDFLPAVRDRVPQLVIRVSGDLDHYFIAVGRQVSVVYFIRSQNEFRRIEQIVRRRSVDTQRRGR